MLLIAQSVREEGQTQTLKPRKHRATPWLRKCCGKAGEQFLDLASLGISQAIQRLIRRIERFHPQAIGKNDLVSVEDRKNIGHSQRIDDADVAVVDQVLGRNQRLVCLQFQHRMVGTDQHPVVRADQHVFLGHRLPKAALAQQNRAQMRARHQACIVETGFKNLTKDLRAMIAGQHLLPRGQRFNRPLSGRSRNQGAGRKAGQGNLSVTGGPARGAGTICRGFQLRRPDRDQHGCRPLVPAPGRSRQAFTDMTHGHAKKAPEVGAQTRQQGIVGGDV